MPCLPIWTSLTLSLGALDFHSFLLGLKNLILCCRLDRGYAPWSSNWEPASRHMLLLLLQMLRRATPWVPPSWLIGIYLGSLPQQLENPCLQGSPKDTILYDYWCKPPVNDGSSSHCGHEWGPSYKSCSDHVRQLVWQHSVGFFVLLPARHLYMFA